MATNKTLSRKKKRKWYFFCLEIQNSKTVVKYEIGQNCALWNFLHSSHHMRIFHKLRIHSNTQKMFIRHLSLDRSQFCWILYLKTVLEFRISRSKKLSNYWPINGMRKSWKWGCWMRNEDGRSRDTRHVEPLLFDA